MARRGLRDIFLGSSFYLSTINLMARPVNLPELMIDTSASKASKCIEKVRNDKNYSMDSGGLFSRNNGMCVSEDSK